jgi:oxidoreductase
MLTHNLGAVGKQVLKEILKNNDYQKVISIGRRSVEIEKEIPQERLVNAIYDMNQSWVVHHF